MAEFAFGKKYPVLNVQLTLSGKKYVDGSFPKIPGNPVRDVDGIFVLLKIPGTNGNFEKVVLLSRLGRRFCTKIRVPLTRFVLDSGLLAPRPRLNENGGILRLDQRKVCTRVHVSASLHVASQISCSI